MKGLIIVFLIIVLLGGVGGGLTAFGVVPDVLGVKALLAELIGDPPATEEATLPPPEPEPEPDLDPEPTFMRVPQMAVPVLMDGRAPKHILLSLRLHVDPDRMADVRRDMPRLQDAYVTALLKTLPDILDRSGRIDLASVKVVLNTVTDRAIGPGKIHDVLIDSAFER